MNFFTSFCRYAVTTSVAGIVMSSLIGCQPKGPVLPPKTPDEIRIESSLVHTIGFQGETLGLIARWYTGDTANWQAIVDNNPGIDPKRLKIGQVVLVPRSLVVREDALTKKALSAGGGAPGAAKIVRPVVTSPAGDSASPTPAASTTSSAAETSKGVPVKQPSVVEEPVTPESVGQAPTAPGAPRSRDELLKELLEEF